MHIHRTLSTNPRKTGTVSSAALKGLASSFTRGWRASVRFALLAGSLTGAFLLLTGCSSNPHSPAEKYILVAANTKVQYWQTALAGLNHAATEMQVKAEMQGPDGHDPQAEHDAFRRAIAQKPAGIMVSVSDANVIGPDIEAALNAGIPVITMDSDAPSSKRLFFIGTDNYNAGVLGGNLASKLLNGKGSVVIYRLPNQNNQKDRLSGYQAAFSAHPEIKVSQVIDLQDQPDISGFAYDTTKKMIDSKTNVNAFVCLESRSCGGVADAVNRAGMAGKVVIVAMDTDSETLDWMQKGVTSATIAQKPFTMGYYGAKLLGDLHLHPPKPLISDWSDNANAPIPTFVDTGSFIVDKSSVSSFLQQNKAATSGQ
jgi:ribose transport system substrate-binding protein